jgi:hypothetical protein
MGEINSIPNNFHEHLSEKIRKNVDIFLAKNSLKDWYNNYNWDNDSKQSSFQNIVDLEIQLSQAAKNNTITSEHVMKIARWGAHPMIDKIRCNSRIDLPLFENNKPAAWIQDNPEYGITLLRPQVYYVGPTYMTKILRFSMPLEFGALDTRITRVFGKGDPLHSYLPFLELEAEDHQGKWFIKYPQPAWPSEYSTFIFILRFMVEDMNRAGIPCPHPEVLYDHGLRRRGIWECADVEMALFSFASEKIYPSNDASRRPSK